MVGSYSGTLITCDVPIKQFILHLDAQQRHEAGWESFVKHDLDDTHLFIDGSRLEFIRQKVAELQDSNSFQRTEEGNAPPVPKRQERKVKRPADALASGD